MVAMNVRTSTLRSAVPGKRGLKNQSRRMQTSAENEQDYVASHRLVGHVARGSLSALGFFVLLATAVAQISPGPLSRPHQSLKGSTNCPPCHKFGGQAALKCLNCHAEIATRLNTRRGLHAT